MPVCVLGVKTGGGFGANCAGYLVSQIDKGKYKPCREITLEVCLAKEEDSNGQVETAVGISDGD